MSLIYYSCSLRVCSFTATIFMAIGKGGGAIVANDPEAGGGGV